MPMVTGGGDLEMQCEPSQRMQPQPLKATSSPLSSVIGSTILHRAKSLPVLAPSPKVSNARNCYGTERFDVEAHARLRTDPSPNLKMLPLSRRRIPHSDTGDITDHRSRASRLGTGLRDGVRAAALTVQLLESLRAR